MREILESLHKDDKKSFMQKVKIAYRDCALCLVQKKRIENKLLQCASAIYPIAHKTKNAAVLNDLHTLPDLMHKVLNEQERDYL